MVSLDSHRIPRAPWYSGTHQETLIFRLQAFHFLWGTIPNSSARSKFCNSLPLKVDEPYNTPINRGLGYSLFAHRYLGNHIRFLFLGLLRCFSSATYLLRAYEFSTRSFRFHESGLPHSEIPGLALLDSCPRLIAV